MFEAPETDLMEAPGFSAPEHELVDAPDQPKEPTSAFGAALKAGARAFPSLAAGGLLAGEAEPIIAPISALTGPLAPLTHGVLSLGTALAGTVASRWAQDKAAEALIPKDTPVLSELRPEVAQQESEEHPAATMAGELLSGGTPNLVNLARTGKTIAGLLTSEGRPLLQEAYQNLANPEPWIKAATDATEKKARKSAVQGIQSTLNVGIGAGMFGGQALVEGRPVHDVLTEAAIGAAFTGKSPLHMLHDVIGGIHPPTKEAFEKSIDPTLQKDKVAQDVQSTSQQIQEESPETSKVLEDIAAKVATAPIKEPEAKEPEPNEKSANESILGGGIPQPIDPTLPESAVRWRQSIREDEPTVAPGNIRMYHGASGAAPMDRPAWLTPLRDYAEGYASKSSDGKIYYVDIPRNSPELKKSFDDSGGVTPSPPVSFEAGQHLFSGAKELPFGSKKPITPVVSEETPVKPSSEPVDASKAPLATTTLETPSDASTAVPEAKEGVLPSVSRLKDEGFEDLPLHEGPQPEEDYPSSKLVPGRMPEVRSAVHVHPETGEITEAADHYTAKVLAKGADQAPLKRSEKAAISRAVRERDSSLEFSVEGQEKPVSRKDLTKKLFPEDKDRKLVHSSDLPIENQMSLMDVKGKDGKPLWADEKGRPSQELFEHDYKEGALHDQKETREEYLNRKICGG